MTASCLSAPVEAEYVFRLYVTSTAPNSTLAVANLQAICQKYLPSQHRIEIVDVFQEPSRSLADGILVTPTLIKLAPAPRQEIIGDLSQTRQVLLSFGLRLETQ